MGVLNLKGRISQKLGPVVTRVPTDEGGPDPDQSTGPGYSVGVIRHIGSEAAIFTSIPNLIYCRSTFRLVGGFAAGHDRYARVRMGFQTSVIIDTETDIPYPQYSDLIGERTYRSPKPFPEPDPPLDYTFSFVYHAAEDVPHRATLGTEYGKAYVSMPGAKDARVLKMRWYGDLWIVYSGLPVPWQPTGDWVGGWYYYDIPVELVGPGTEYPDWTPGVWLDGDEEESTQ